MTSLTTGHIECNADTARLWTPAASRVCRWGCAFVLLAACLATIAAIVPIPLTISADACQILLAADRLTLGLGPTTIYPKVPEVDWAFINHWPVGYPLLLWAVSTLAGISALDAAQVINVCAFAVSFLAWAAWFRRCLPASPAAQLLALTGGLLSLDPMYLWEPATDMILVALTPVALLLTERITRSPRTVTSDRRSGLRFLLLGVAVGALTWIRYTGLYLTIGVGLFLLCLRFTRHRPRWGVPAAFIVGALMPLLLLAAVNGRLGHSIIDEPASALGLDFDLGWPLIWWKHFVQLPFLRSWWRSPMIFATIIPVIAILIMAATGSTRRAARGFFRHHSVQLSVGAVGGMFALLMLYRIFAQSFFVVEAEPRYLMCVRPFYLVLLAGPLLSIRWRSLRRAVCLALLAGVYWLVQAEWIDATRLRVADAPATTAYGRAARCFATGPDELYAWLGRNADANSIVFSNFFDEIALESHVPAQPLPAGVDALRDAVRRISIARGCNNPRLLFVLEPDNQWRHYYLNAWQAIDTFGLERMNAASAVVRRYVFMPRHPERWIDD